ncbi:MAG TPA: hypothetical protein VKB61_10860 [Candidatus Acidoferrum sp.]|nr:hypothetical protein [Candidatus Acidoferrum sp.]
MRRTVVLFLLSSLAVLLLAAPQSRGDGVDTFTFTEVEGGLVASATWQSLATPDSFSLGSDFLLSGVSADVSFDGVYVLTESLDLSFYSSVYSQTSGTGELFDAADVFGSAFGLCGTDQLYFGSEGSPTFLSGTYTGTDPDTGGTATLVISAPEPSSLLLLFSALLSIAGVLFVQKLQL